jgi:hypothetical protein
MALLPLIRNGVVALVAMALLLSSDWHCCPHCNDIVVIIDVLAIVARCQAGVVTLIVMVLLPSMRRHLCCCCNGNCRSRHKVVIAVVDVHPSPLLLS